jgi:hypothetical protein
MTKYLRKISREPFQLMQKQDKKERFGIVDWRKNIKNRRNTSPSCRIFRKNVDDSGKVIKKI